MTELAAIANWSVFAFVLLLWVAQMLAHETGYWAGFGRRARGGEVQAKGVSVVVAGMLSLLVFVLALTLSFANTRFSERVEGTLTEANAIGTAWLRAEAIDHIRGPEIARLLEQYAQVRRDFVSERRDQSAIDELNRRTNTLQSKIWGHMAAIAREQPNTVSTSLMSALNDAFDQATAERFAFYLRLPSPIFWAADRDDAARNGCPWLSTRPHRQASTHIGGISQHHVDGRDCRHPRPGLASYRRSPRQRRRLRLDLARLQGRAPDPAAT